MPSLKDLKTRIKSVKSTQKITSAMKMVAASKLKRATEEAGCMKKYIEGLEETVQVVMRSSDMQTSFGGLYQLIADSQRTDSAGDALEIGGGLLVVIISSDRGLCGGFNASLMKKVKSDLELWREEGREISIICIGKKGYDMLDKRYRPFVVERKSGINNKGSSVVDESRAIAGELIKLYAAKRKVACYIYSMRMVNALTQVPNKKLLLPISEREDVSPEGGKPKLEEGGAGGQAATKQSAMRQAETERANVFECEPLGEELLPQLIERQISMQLCYGIMESAAAEQAARMSAMDNATRNCGELLKKLALLYNRTRQAYITKELIEIISGAEAV